MASGTVLRGGLRSLHLAGRQILWPSCQSGLHVIPPGSATQLLTQAGGTGQCPTYLGGAAMLSSQAPADGRPQEQATGTAERSAGQGTSGQVFSGAGGAAALDAAALGPETSAGGAELEGLAAEPGRQSFWWQALKFGLGTAVTAAVASGAYVTYKYDTETLQEKLQSARASLMPAAAKEELQNEARVQGPLEGLYGAAANGLLHAAQAYLDLRTNVEEQIRGWSAPSSDKLLPDLLPQEQNIYTLVLDLNDTLVHSDWKRERGWRTFKRPGVEAFLEKMAQNYEVVVFSDQLNITVDPILDRLDQKGYIRYRLYRDGTLYDKGHYFRDLTKLNRDPRKVLYLTGHPDSCLQKENVLTIPAWKVSDLSDTALLDLIPFLEYVARHRPVDTRAVLASYEGQDIPEAFKERSREVMRRQQERKQQGLFRLVTR